MKGFKDKSGKFRPTGKINRSPLTIAELRDKGRLEMQQGFKVYPNTTVSVETKEIKPEIIARVQTLWNEDPHIKKLRKHVHEIDFNPTDPENKYSALWIPSESKFILNEGDSGHEAELATAHEVVGHVFWDWAREWRREELAEFNKLANEMPPINGYVEHEEEGWRNYDDDHERLRQISLDYVYVIDTYYDEGIRDKQVTDELDKLQNEFDTISDDEGHQSMTRYANEQHSAMTELIYGVGEPEEGIFLDDDQLEALTNAWYKLHS